MLGDGAPLRRAAALAGLAPGADGNAAERLALGDVIRDGDPLAFARPMVREAVTRSCRPRGGDSRTGVPQGF